MTLAFPNRDAVVADIVLIAWKSVDTLRTCLTSLLAMTDAPAFGVRIASNGATDEVRRFLRDEVTGVAVVDLPANVGFGAGCNAGAAGSTAEHLVFLNDDTVVSPNWLAALVDAATSRTAGAFASVLLDEDGTIQEAGARILGNGDPQPCARGLALPQARDLGLLDGRRIDYGSAAALLVRRELFERIGGFDLAFKPAYYEDVDLCFRIAAVGSAVELAPDAFVTHFTGASTSDDLMFREYASFHSRGVFVERWARSLRTALPDTAPAVSTLTVDPSEWPDEAAAPVAEPLDSEAALRLALEIRTDYAQWLRLRLENEILTHTEVAIDRTRLAVAALDANTRIDGLDGLIEVARQREQTLAQELQELKSASLVALLSWWRRARRE